MVDDEYKDYIPLKNLPFTGITAYQYESVASVEISPYKRNFILFI